MPKPAQVRSLFRSFLRQGAKFPNYNIREYTKRKAKEDFRAHQHVSDAAEQEALWAKAQAELQLVQRQLTLYSLYARKHRSVMDVPLGRVLEKQAASVEGLEAT